MGERGMSPTRREGSVGLLGFHGDAMARSREEPSNGEVMVAGEVIDTSSHHREGGDTTGGDTSTGIVGFVDEERDATRRRC